MVHLIFLLEAAQNRDRVLHGRLADEALLEAALEGRILLDVLLVLVEGRGSHATELPAGEHRLEHVGRIHRAFGRPGADQRVDLIDEKNDPAFLLLL